MKSAGSPSANAATAWPVLSWQADQTKRPICSLMARAEPMRNAVAPLLFWTLFLLPLSFRTNFSPLLESRNRVALPLLQRLRCQANVNDVQRRDISFFFVGWVGVEGRSGSLFSACLTLSVRRVHGSGQQRTSRKNLNAVSAQMGGQRYVSGGNHRCAILQGCGKAVGLELSVCVFSFLQSTKL